MKSTGITRQVDTLGRVVLPKELRRNMGLVTDVINYHGKMICRACLAKLVEEAAK